MLTISDISRRALLSSCPLIPSGPGELDLMYLRVVETDEGVNNSGVFGSGVLLINRVMSGCDVPFHTCWKVLFSVVARS